MYLDKLNKWLILAANLGVIAGIILLAIELQQNNELLAAQARSERIDARKQNYEIILENEDLRQTFINQAFGGQSSEEEILATAYQAISMINYEHLWQEYEAGLLTLKDLNIEPRIRAWANDSGGRRARWEILKPNFHPDFVIWMEENIIDP